MDVSKDGGEAIRRITSGSRVTFSFTLHLLFYEHMSPAQTPLTKEDMVDFVTTFMHEFESRMNARSDAQFAAVTTRLDRHDELLANIHGKLTHHDDLLETIAAEVSDVQNTLAPLIPEHKNHEERIVRLERGYTRLILRH